MCNKKYFHTKTNYTKRNNITQVMFIRPKRSYDQKQQASIEKSRSILRSSQV